MKKLYIPNNDFIFITSNASMNANNYTNKKYENQKSHFWTENLKPIPYYKKNIIRNIYYAYSIKEQKLLIILNIQSFEICKDLLNYP